jgi:hypothetical protein
MKAVSKYGVLVVLSFCCLTTELWGGGWKFGVGASSGLARLEGDVNNSSLSPMASGYLRALPLPFVVIEGSLGYASLNTSNNSLETTIIPLELSGLINFLPQSRVNPYLRLGVGGVVWKNNVASLSNKLDRFFKTGGGLEFRVSRDVGVDVGATFRLSQTDVFDQNPSGDENDQVLDFHAGFTYYFGGGSRDRDHDGIPDELDLMPDIAEDRDGYLDHDGIPEKNPNPVAMASLEPSVNAGQPTVPIVIHKILENLESGRNVAVNANVHTNSDLRAVAILYRPSGTTEWNVARMENDGQGLYEGTIPGYAVTTAGLEYCVVAVDQSLKGIGYSGLPHKPIVVQVVPGGNSWRIVGGAVGAAAVGAASYMVVRKQN